MGMFGSQVLDVAIGVVFVYLMLSVVCSVVQENISGALNWRSKTLVDAVRNILHDPDGDGVARDFYNHPLIRALAKDGSKPSYIPTGIFVTALLDVIAPAEPEAEPLDIQNLRYAAAQIDGNDALRRTLLSLMGDRTDDLSTAREKIGTWFNESMTRASGWYKRKANTVIFICALATTVVLNADTFQIAETIWSQAPLRESMVKAAETRASLGLPEDPKDVELDMSLLPLGWENPGPRLQKAAELLSQPGWYSSWDGIWSALSHVYSIFKKIIGLAITTFAVALGAPFWFDLLNKMINIRSGGRRPEPKTQT